MTEFFSNPMWPFVVAWPIVAIAWGALAAGWLAYLNRRRRP